MPQERTGGGARRPRDAGRPCLLQQPLAGGEGPVQSTVCLKNKSSLFSKCRPMAQPLLRDLSGSIDPFPLLEYSVLHEPTAPP